MQSVARLLERYGVDAYLTTSLQDNSKPTSSVLFPASHSSMTAQHAQRLPLQNRYPPSGAFFSQSVIAPATNISTVQPPAGVKLFDADEVVRAAQSYLHDSGHTSAQSPILLSKLGLQQVVKKSMVGANDAGLSLSQILRSKHDIFGFCGQSETTAVYLLLSRKNDFHKSWASPPLSVFHVHELLLSFFI
jgi:hypothetical protein